ncbi:MAG: hypothetical protein KGM92_15555, partial [Acidobacteriota bacterium]|nr:hypothetical protein [Acidobacteriota bacterium]
MRWNTSAYWMCRLPESDARSTAWRPPATEEYFTRRCRAAIDSMAMALALPDRRDFKRRRRPEMALHRIVRLEDDERRGSSRLPFPSAGQPDSSAHRRASSVPW